MQLTVLGCRSGMPADGQASSGYLVEEGATRVLLDCGPGIATMLSALCATPRLDAVVISHLHIDHCYDLLPLGKAMLAGRMAYPGLPLPPRAEAAPPVPLYVPVGGRTVLEALAAQFPMPTLPILERTFDLAFDVREYAPQSTVEVGDLRLTLIELVHALTNCGVRVEGATGSLAYTGDTGVTDALVTLARDVDLFLAEATLPATDPGPHGHLSGADAGRAAEAAGARHLVLTHFLARTPDWLRGLNEDAAAVYTGPITLAEPGLRLDTPAVRAVVG